MWIPWPSFSTGSDVRGLKHCIWGDGHDFSLASRCERVLAALILPAASKQVTALHYQCCIALIPKDGQENTFYLMNSQHLANANTICC
jgi:hypothetical protein